MNSQIYQLPQEFVHRLKKIYPSRFNEIFATFRQKKITSFRINYLKTDLVSLTRQLKEANVRFKELSFPAGSFLLKGSLRDFQNTDVYRKGLVYVQNVSSMIPAIILDPQNNERILDLCAAPGAKTTQMASLAPQAKIIAVDKVRKRYYKLLANLRAQGVGNVEVLLLDGIWVRKKFPEYFDKILVDAPCSVEGTFYLPNKHSYKYWKPRKVKEMVRTQKKLLHSSFFALREEGTLIYSTCTFSPEENEEVIDWFIGKFKDKVELLPIDIPLDNVTSGLARWKNRKFSSPCRLCKRIIPNDFMEGFFIAKIKKVSV
ncbi:MAG: RsmB/NOP family class I SAM-dependent RNA methyltransferase [Candidatus Omnitrophota bacterium]|nr:MAG: RsmB/NOP family class I SAM-dependent RNA methyltransferase [Candidatus Omnitrophota bacterium]